MTKELEQATVDELGTDAGRGVSPVQSHTRTECLNCAAKLQGPFCFQCGQSADDHHRPIGHLLWEAVEGFTHLDGRLAKTLPALLFHPGKLARDHIEGRRVRHVPPFRMFLISLVIFMFAAEWSVNRSGPASVQAQHASSKTAPRSYRVGDTKVIVAHPSDINQVLQQSDNERIPFQGWLKTHVGRAAQNHDLFMMLVFEWAHRLAIFMLPIMAALLSLFYINKHQFYIYDHLVASMQYLSFCFLVWAVAWIMPDINTSVWSLAAMIWAPFNLYLILRSVYGSSRLGAGIKTLALSLATVMTFTCLLTGLLVFALSQV